MKPDIQFNAEQHRYWDANTGHEYVSVTEYIKQFRTFDRMAASARYAAKYGLQQAEVLEAWDNTTKQGSALHAAIEGYLKRRENAPQYPGLCECAGNWVAAKANGHSNLRVERIAWHQDSRLAGTPDFTITNAARKSVLIGDWKFADKGISKDNYGKHMKAPLAHMQDSKFFGYALQVSMYGLFYETMGYTPDELWLLALRLRNGLWGVEPMRVPYLRDEALAVVEHRKLQLAAL